MTPSAAEASGPEDLESLAVSPKETHPVEPAPGPEPIDEAAVIGLEQVQEHEGVKTFISLADRYLGEIGYTEHGFRHAGLVSKISYNVLHRLGFEDRMAELGAISGYLHDMGNFVSRTMHTQTGAAITYDLLKELGMSYGEIGIVMAAIGNHEEEFGHPVNPAGAALDRRRQVRRSSLQGPGEGSAAVRHPRPGQSRGGALVPPGGPRSAYSHPGADDRYRASGGHGVLRDLPVAHGYVPAGGGVPRVQFQDRHQRRKAVVSRGR